MVPSAANQVTKLRPLLTSVSERQMPSSARQEQNPVVPNVRILFIIFTETFLKSVSIKI